MLLFRPQSVTELPASLGHVFGSGVTTHITTVHLDTPRGEDRHIRARREASLVHEGDTILTFTARSEYSFELRKIRLANCAQYLLSLAQATIPSN